MSIRTTSSRRNFLKGGALLAAPLAAASVSAAVMADGTLLRRVTQLEDEAAIRALHRGWLRKINAGEHDTELDASVRRITADHAGAPDRIDMAVDQQSAVSHFVCPVDFETPLEQDSTLAQMAHAQGHGAMRHTQRRLLTVSYLKVRAKWEIAKVALSVSSSRPTPV